MAKDYAKKSKPKNGASRFNQKDEQATIPGWTWLLAGLIIGLVLSLVTYLQLDTKSQTDTPKIEKPKPSAKTRYKAVKPDASKESDFSFHDALINKVVKTPENDNKLPAKDEIEKTYIMQCGSFKQKELAESLKATIALNGYTAKINPTVEKSGTTWFRVSLGPYTSKRKAESDRHQLQRNNINNCRIW